jgi:hypothetical protein
MTCSKEAILEESVREEQRITELEHALAEARARSERLRSELETASGTPPVVSPLPSAGSGKTPQTPADKVQLFRSLFRGRQDIFPTRFVSKRTGKPGYAPECSNKFHAGLCILKIGGKCSECPNQAFSPVSDQAILDHLQGRHVMGVYPLLEDETSWFLAADFDKSSWKEDVAAVVETCRGGGVPVAIERSRSGNGAHAWFFFTAPVRATWRGEWLLPHHRSDDPSA